MRSIADRYRQHGLDPQDLTAPDKLAEILERRLSWWRTAAIVAAILALAAMVGVAAMGRYSVAAAGPFAYVLDRITGDVTVLSGGSPVK